MELKTVGEAITDPFLDCAAYQMKPLLLGEKGITNELCLQYCTAITTVLTRYFSKASGIFDIKL